MKHVLGAEGPLPAVGSTVHRKLDWEHRYKLMRTRTAMHILCGVVFAIMGRGASAEKWSRSRGGMDFEFETL